MRLLDLVGPVEQGVNQGEAQGCASAREVTAPVRPGLPSDRS